MVVLFVCLALLLTTCCHGLPVEPKTEVEVAETTTENNVLLADGSPIILTKPPTIQRFVIGEPFVLECLAESDDSINYSWLKNGRALDVDQAGNIFWESRVRNGNILVLAEKDDEGTYQCVAENDKGKSFSQSSLVMMRQPKTPKLLDLDGPRLPIVEKVAENLPAFVEDGRESRRQDIQKVFIVYPEEQKEENVEVIDMITDDNSDIAADVKGSSEAATSTTEAIEVTQELATEQVPVSTTTEETKNVSETTTQPEEITTVKESETTTIFS